MGDRGGSPGSRSPVKLASSTRLHSWKEIAAYLGRDERTVRRWEKAEGLPVHRLQHAKAGSVFAEIAELDAWTAGRTDGAPKQRESAVATRRRWRLLPSWAIALSAAAALIGIVWLTTVSVTPENRRTETPLTSDPGTELEPRLSPDGKAVAYAWDGEDRGNFDLYIRLVAGGPPVRLTTDPAPDYSPAWSPDGVRIAFLRQFRADAAAVVTMPALGGIERKVAEFGTGLWPEWGRPGPFLAWSPDGNWLIAAGHYGGDNSDRLLRIAVTSGEIQPLTSPPRETMGDTGPAISPDGTKLAFSRRLSWGASELYVLPLSADAMPAGQATRVETGWAWNVSPAWMPEGRTLIFSTGRMDYPRLARTSIVGPAPASPVADVGDYGWHPSLAKTDRGELRLVYTHHFESVNIWRQPLDGSGPAEELISAAHWSFQPDHSPNGERIAFLSDRSGDVEIWVAGADGKFPQQWTFLKQSSLGAPRWSPDNKRIAFSAPGRNGSSIYVIDGPGVPPRPVPGSERCGYLAWSADGRVLYFSSNRRGAAEIWKIPQEGGKAVQVTAAGGRVPATSPDGRFLYYLRMVTPAGDNHLYRMPVSGGAEERILQFVESYSVGRTGIGYKHYRTGREPEGPDLRFFRFATKETERLPETPKPLRYDVSISPDGRSLLYAQSDYNVSDLMLVDGFR